MVLSGQVRSFSWSGRYGWYLPKDIGLGTTGLGGIPAILVRGRHAGQVGDRRRPALAGRTALRLGVYAAYALQLLFARREDERVAAQAADQLAVLVSGRAHAAHHHRPSLVEP